MSSDTVQIVAFDVGIRNFAFCILNHNVATKFREIVALDVVDLGCSPKNKQGAIDAVLDLLDELVFQHLDTNKQTVVLIEQQMTSAMKAIQVAINVFFKMSAKYNSMDVTTKYLSAKHKLALQSKYPEFEADNQNIASTKYKQNKMDGVNFGMWLLKNKIQDQTFYEKVAKMKKKDDACDSFIMTVYYADCMC